MLEFESGHRPPQFICNFIVSMVNNSHATSHLGEIEYVKFPLVANETINGPKNVRVICVVENNAPVGPQMTNGHLTVVQTTLVRMVAVHVNEIVMVLEAPNIAGVNDSIIRVDPEASAYQPQRVIVVSVYAVTVTIINPSHGWNHSRLFTTR